MLFHQHSLELMTSMDFDTANMNSNFNKILYLIYAKSPLQKKKLAKYLSKQDEKFFVDAEEFATNYLNYLIDENISLEYVVDAYLKMCSDMLKSQITFMKTGCYPVELSQDAFETVYSNETEMKSYMIGLALSQFLWESHFKIYNTFERYLQKSKEHIHSYLEIGPGHGLFLNKAINYLAVNTSITVVDVSPISTNITKSIIKYFHPDRGNIIFYNVDMLEIDLAYQYDFITMGEVIEHVNSPEKLLNKLNNILASNGRAFVSTCVNCPAIDHVYHFHTVDEIRDMFSKCGFAIEEEQVLPVEDLCMQEIKEKKITINYCAIFKRGD